MRRCLLDMGVTATSSNRRLGVAELRRVRRVMSVVDMQLAAIAFAFGN
jgi:hypothetical protein